MIASPAADPLMEAARRLFGVDYLFPYQRLVISNILDADPEAVVRQIVVLPTGAGKSLCFQLPAMLARGVTVVVYPLLSLMADQLRRMGSAGLAAVAIRGGQPRGERASIWREVAKGEPVIVLTNPESLLQPEVRERLAAASVTHLVVDEAHCVSEWGESFRPSYLELPAAVQAIRPAKITAFTATASPLVLGSIRRILFGGAPVHLVESLPDRPNITYSVIRPVCKHRALRRLFGAGGSPALERPAIVFCRSRKRVEEVARTLHSELGPGRALAYHAGLSREERELTEQRFFASKTAVLAATCAYGMGVDKGDVRSVVHFDLPSTVEAYLQESGRAGRDRATSHAVLLADSSDLDGERADPLQLERYRQMIAYVQTSGCRREYLMRLMGHELESCFGCDNCWERGGDPHAVLAPPPRRVAEVSEEQRSGAERLARAARRFRRRHSRHALACLCAESPWAARAPRRLTLPRWSVTEVEEAIAELTAAGALRTIRRGPWKGTIAPGRGAGRRGRRKA